MARCALSSSGLDAFLASLYVLTLRTYHSIKYSSRLAIIQRLEIMRLEYHALDSHGDFDASSTFFADNRKPSFHTIKTKSACKAFVFQNKTRARLFFARKKRVRLSVHPRALQAVWRCSVWKVSEQTG